MLFGLKNRFKNNPKATRRLSKAIRRQSSDNSSNFVSWLMEILIHKVAYLTGKLND